MMAAAVLPSVGKDEGSFVGETWYYRNMRNLIAKIFGPHCAHGELAAASIAQVLEEEGWQYLP